MFDILGFFEKKASSKDIAKDRLKLVLVHDRANCSPEILNMIRVDILKVISSYMEIDEEELDIQISQTQATASRDAAPVLYANIPIKSLKKSRKAQDR